MLTQEATHKVYGHGSGVPSRRPPSLQRRGKGVNRYAGTEENCTPCPLKKWLKCLPPGITCCLMRARPRYLTQLRIVQVSCVLFVLHKYRVMNSRVNREGVHPCVSVCGMGRNKKKECVLALFMCAIFFCGRWTRSGQTTARRVDATTCNE